MAFTHTLLRLVASTALLLGGASCESSSPMAPSPGAMPGPGTTPTVADTARYEVVLESTWSAATHPADFPDAAHYSGLIGGTHRATVSFWREGVLATEGIRRMAERGSKSPLDAEVMQAIAAGHAQFVLSGDALATSPGSVSLAFDITRAYPLVTLVTMVAPSPDWFVGVSGLPLFANGDWLPEVSVPLHPLDAGTDSGTTYQAADRESQPRQPIARLTGYPVSQDGAVAPFGTMTFRRR